MHGRVMSLRDNALLPQPHTDGPLRPLDVIVLYTNPALTARALESARELARGFEAAITLVAVYVLPYPAELECLDGIRGRLENELAVVVQSSSVETRVKLVFARDRADACLGLLRRGSLVVIGSQKRWWRTSEEKLARRLTAAGHSVALVKAE